MKQELRLEQITLEQFNQLCESTGFRKQDKESGKERMFYRISKPVTYKDFTGLLEDVQSSGLNLRTVWFNDWRSSFSEAHDFTVFAWEEYYQLIMDLLPKRRKAVVEIAAGHQFKWLPHYNSEADIFDVQQVEKSWVLRKFLIRNFSAYKFATPDGAPLSLGPANPHFVAGIYANEHIQLLNSPKT